MTRLPSLRAVLIALVALQIAVMTPLQAALDALPDFGASAFASRTYPPVNPPPIR